MLKKTIFATLIAVLMLTTGCSKEKQNTEANELKPTNKYVLTSTDDNNFTFVKKGNGFVLEGSEDKILIFDIFATWCPPCQKAAQHMGALQKKYKDKIVVFGVSIEDNLNNQQLKEFKKMYHADYNILNSNLNRVLADKIVATLNMGNRYPIPVVVLYKNGKYITHYVGSVEEEFVQSDIEQALKQ